MKNIDLDGVSTRPDDGEIAVVDSEIGSSGWRSEQLRAFRGAGLVEVEEGSEVHRMIENAFLASMRGVAKDMNVNVVSICKNVGSNLAGRARLETFRIFSEAVAKKCGGDANIRYAWYGCGSGDEICKIMSHGFTASTIGVSLFPANRSADGVLAADEDENGTRHVLFCRVILGKTEVICAGSQQFHPTSEEFDSGVMVDDLSARTRYIVWNAYMNSHIFPTFIVSFRASSSKGLQRSEVEHVLKPNSPYVKLPTLMPILSSFLPPPKMALIYKYHCDFLDNKISRPQLVRRVRQLAGDKLLRAIIKSHTKIKTIKK